MRVVKIEEIVVTERQRKEITPKELNELKRGILSKGLMHPPVVIERNGQLQLVGGERRLRALRELHEESHKISYDKEEIPLFTTPYTLLGELDDIALREAELEENVLRVNLSWLEESVARAAIHELRCGQNPNQTQIETATELAELKGTNPGTERVNLAGDLIIAKNLDSPLVKQARTRREALVGLLDQSETLFKAKNAALLKTQTSDDHTVINGDLFEEVKKLPAGTFDTIFCDPPYGIGMDNVGKGEFHLYDDSPEAGVAISKFILEEGFRVTKSRALLFMFCDVEHFITIRDYAARMAWTPWRTPITWIKGNDGHAPWGRAGFVRTTEVILFATKGQKELIRPGGPDHLLFKRPGRADRLHAAEKPKELLKYILEISTLAGQHVLDPCCGSGSLITAAKELKIQTTCIEKNEDYYNQALIRSTEEVAPLDDGETPFPAKPVSVLED